MDHTEFLAISEEAVAHLKRIMRDFPHLVSPHVKSAVENWSRRGPGGGSVEWMAKDLKKAEQEVLVATAIDLIGQHQLEDVLAIINQEFDADLDYAGLIGLVGEDRYSAALQREAVELKLNAVSFEQVADLWNAMGKPALGDRHWTVQAVSALSARIIQPG